MFKVTMVIRLATVVSDPNAPARRVGGWTESFYDGDPLDKVKTDLDRLCVERAKMLPKGAAIIGQRIQDVGPPVGASNTKRVLFPGNPLFACDIPQMTLLCSVQGRDVRNVRNVELRGIPDGNVVEGEYKPSDDFTRGFNAFSNWLGGYQFKGKDLDAPFVDVMSITPVANSATKDATVDPENFNADITVGDIVKVMRSRDAAGNFQGGRFKVKAVDLFGRLYTISKWNGGETAGGVMRIDRDRFCVIPVSKLEISQIVTRKVGRPSDQYHGRVSKRS